VGLFSLSRSIGASPLSLLQSFRSVLYFPFPYIIEYVSRQLYLHITCVSPHLSHVDRIYFSIFDMRLLTIPLQDLPQTFRLRSSQTSTTMSSLHRLLPVNTSFAQHPVFLVIGTSSSSSGIVFFSTTTYALPSSPKSCPRTTRGRVVVYADENVREGRDTGGCGG
jgi:hypothetical protein